MAKKDEIVEASPSHPIVTETLSKLSDLVDMKKFPDNFWETFKVSFEKVLRQTMPLAMREHECLLALRELNALNEHLISRDKVNEVVSFNLFSFMLSQGFLKDNSEGVFITESGFAFLLKGEQNA
jgi:hypothetical protein